jgi:hypothetical protein
LVLAVSGVASAHAQGCEDLTRPTKSSHAQVKALQGEIKAHQKELAFTTKTGVARFSNCRLMSAKEADTCHKHLKHRLWCEGYGATADVADDAIVPQLDCAKDRFSERQAVKAWICGRNRVICFGAEARSAGHAAGPVEFAKAVYARMTLEKSYDPRNKSNQHIYWMSMQPAGLRTSVTWPVARSRPDSSAPDSR